MRRDIDTPGGYPAITRQVLHPPRMANTGRTALGCAPAISPLVPVAISMFPLKGLDISLRAGYRRTGAEGPAVANPEDSNGLCCGGRMFTASEIASQILSG